MSRDHKYVCAFPPPKRVSPLPRPLHCVRQLSREFHNFLLCWSRLVSYDGNASATAPTSSNGALADAAGLTFVGAAALGAVGLAF